jgi:polar amino acid transport system ATP-binding protein
MTITSQTRIPTGLMVDADQVSKSFGSNEVLKSITLKVKPGEVLCIVGPSGSGKSTFLRCINHLETVDAGRLYVEDVLVGYREKGHKLHELPRSWPRRSDATSGWCSSGSTCFRT